MLQRLALAALLLALFLTGCKDKESVVSPLSPENNNGKSVINENGQIDPEFKQFLETEIKKEENTLSKSAFHNWFIHKITEPTVITSPGIYQVVNDFNVGLSSESVDDAVGILVKSNFVLLIIGDHWITGPGNKVGTGVRLDSVSFVLVFGGKFRTFGTGVELNETETSALRSISVLGGDEFADPPAIPPQVGFMLVNSDWNFISANNAALINLGIFVRGPGSHDNRIWSNNVVGGMLGLLGICYNPHPDGRPGGPTHDMVFRNVIKRFPIGIQTMAVASQNFFTENVIHYFNMPWEDLNGTNIFLNNTTLQITP